jgi:hypothetical protein
VGHAASVVFSEELLRWKKTTLEEKGNASSYLDRRLSVR